MPEEARIGVVHAMPPAGACGSQGEPSRGTVCGGSGWERLVVLLLPRLLLGGRRCGGACGCVGWRGHR
jgi:hypothetical protein